MSVSPSQARDKNGGLTYRESKMVLGHSGVVALW